MADKKETGFVNTVNDASKMKVCCEGQPDKTEDLHKRAKEESKPVEVTTDNVPTQEHGNETKSVGANRHSPKKKEVSDDEHKS